MTANYHTHTSRCGHASGSDREYIEAAIKAGFKCLGFSDHTPMLAFEPDYGIQGYRMPVEAASDYFSSLRKLKEEYKNDISIYIGFEAEYYKNVFERYIQWQHELGCEFLIQGQHQYPAGENEELLYSGSPTKEPEHLRSYFDMLRLGQKSGKFSYIAHPDVINFVGDVKIYCSEVRRFCEEMKEAGMPLEYNLLGFSTKRHYPTDRFFKIAAEVGNKIVIGCDAHSPNVFEDAEGLKRCIEKTESLGLEIVSHVELIPV